jgi:hypothetical protein
VREFVLFVSARTKRHGESNREHNRRGECLA